MCDAETSASTCARRCRTCGRGWCARYHFGCFGQAHYYFPNGSDMAGFDIELFEQYSNGWRSTRHPQHSGPAKSTLGRPWRTNSGTRSDSRTATTNVTKETARIGSQTARSLSLAELNGLQCLYGTEENDGIWADTTVTTSNFTDAIAATFQQRRPPGCARRLPASVADQSNQGPAPREFAGCSTGADPGGSASTRSSSAARSFDRAFSFAGGPSCNDSRSVRRSPSLSR